MYFRGGSLVFLEFWFVYSLCVCSVFAHSVLAKSAKVDDDNEEADAGDAKVEAIPPKVEEEKAVAVVMHVFAVFVFCVCCVCVCVCVCFAVVFDFTM